MCQNKRVESLCQHDEDRAAGVNPEIGDGKLYRTFRAAEQQHDLPRKAERRRTDCNAQQNQQTERRVENPVRLVRPALAKPDAGPRRAAKSDQIRERLHDERDGKHDPERGQRVHTGAIDPRDIHSIDDVV